MDINIHKEIMSLEPSALVVLFEIILKDDGGKKYYFHAGENGYQNDINYKGNNYYFHPIRAEGFDFAEDSLPRPTITADNTDAFFSLKTKYFKDFVGYEIRRISPTEDSFPVEKYIINRKTSENSKMIQWELGSPLEKEHALIPNRKIVFNVCQWGYRSSIGCGYAGGAPVADSKNNKLTVTGPGSPLEYSATATYNAGQYVKISNKNNPSLPAKYFVCLANGTVGANPESDKTKWVEDACSKDVSGCRLRFGGKEASNGLPFGGFPGTWKH
jgi:lambda family phage minor tail protein L